MDGGKGRREEGKEELWREVEEGRREERGGKERKRGEQGIRKGVEEGTEEQGKKAEGKGRLKED